MALVSLGLSSALATDSADLLRSTLGRVSEKLARRYLDESREGWHWFEPTLTYDNAMLPFALFETYRFNGERAGLRVARESLEFLEEVCFRDGKLFLVGNDGWHTRGGVKSESAEQAIDAAAFVLAFHSAYLATGDHHYVTRMRQSFAWFLGANRLDQPLYDFATAGCRDGLGATAANQNQGAESTLSFLMSLMSMLDHATAPSGAEG
jgi:hypothetical protein